MEQAKVIDDRGEVVERRSPQKASPEQRALESTKGRAVWQLSQPSGCIYLAYYAMSGVRGVTPYSIFLQKNIIFLRCGREIGHFAKEWHGRSTLPLGLLYRHLEQIA